MATVWWGAAPPAGGGGGGGGGGASARAHRGRGRGADQGVAWRPDGPDRERVGAARVTEAAAALSLGGITFLLTVIWGGPLIRVLRLLNVGKAIRIEGPQRHFTKLGTPTMGGWLFIIPVLLITGVLNLVTILSDVQVLGRSILLPMGVLLGFALLGALDDWLGIQEGRRGEGLRGLWKFDGT